MPHPEALLLSAVIRTGDYQALAASAISSDLFSAYPDEAKWVEGYIRKNSKAPSKSAFRAKFPEFQLYKVEDTGHWCEEVKREASSTKLIMLMEQAIRSIDGDDVETAMKVLAQGLTDVQAKSNGSIPTHDVFTNWLDTYGDVEARVQRVMDKGFAGIPTGFKSLDAVTGGWQPGWLGIVAARLGVGKTWTTVKMSTHAALLGFKVTYFSLEQSRHQIGMRVHSFASKQFGKMVFDSTDLGRGQGFDIRAYKEFLSELQTRVQGRFLIHDSTRGRVSPLTVAAAIERDQPDVVFIDYLGKMDMEADWKSVGKVAGDLQDIAQRYNTPVVVASQINRAGAGKDPPDAEHLALADRIGQDCDILLTMQQKTEHVMKMKIAKFRHGPTGINWMCEFNPGRGIFDEVSDNKATEISERDCEVD